MVAAKRPHYVHLNEASLASSFSVSKQHSPGSAARIYFPSVQTNPCMSGNFCCSFGPLVILLLLSGTPNLK